MAGKKWMQKAVPKAHEGKFTAKAHAAGKGVQEYAREKEHASGTLGKEARLALTFAKMGRKRRLRDNYKSRKD